MVTAQIQDSQGQSREDNRQDLASKRTKCEVWTRVMGYHRPVQNFNIGKKAEHFGRKHFSEGISCGR